MLSPLISEIRALLRRLGLPLNPRTLAEISALELRTNRVGHQQKISTLNRQIESIESNKEALFKKGVASPSDSFRVDISRQLRILDLDIQGKNKSLRLLFKELEAITGLLILKENQELIRQNGLTSIIARMDLERLTSYVHESTVEGELHWDKLTALCGTLDDSRQTGLESGATLDETQNEYYRAMQNASNNNLAREATNNVKSTRQIDTEAST
jgi:hypothetical protein